MPTKLKKNKDLVILKNFSNLMNSMSDNKELKKILGAYKLQEKVHGAKNTFKELKLRKY